MEGLLTSLAWLFWLLTIFAVPLLAVARIKEAESGPLVSYGPDGLVVEQPHTLDFVI